MGGSLPAAAPADRAKLKMMQDLGLRKTSGSPVGGSKRVVSSGGHKVTVTRTVVVHRADGGSGSGSVHGGGMSGGAGGRTSLTPPTGRISGAITPPLRAMTPPPPASHRAGSPAPRPSPPVQRALSTLSPQPRQTSSGSALRAPTPPATNGGLLSHHQQQRQATAMAGAVGNSKVGGSSLGRGYHGHGHGHGHAHTAAAVSSVSSSHSVATRLSGASSLASSSGGEVVSTVAAQRKSTSASERSGTGLQAGTGAKPQATAPKQMPALVMPRLSLGPFAKSG